MPQGLKGHAGGSGQPGFLGLPVNLFFFTEFHADTLSWLRNCHRGVKHPNVKFCWFLFLVLGSIKRPLKCEFLLTRVTKANEVWMGRMVYKDHRLVTRCYGIAMLCIWLCGNSLISNYFLQGSSGWARK